MLTVLMKDKNFWHSEFVLLCCYSFHGINIYKLAQWSKGMKNSLFKENLGVRVMLGIYFYKFIHSTNINMLRTLCAVQAIQRAPSKMSTMT